MWTRIEDSLPPYGEPVLIARKRSFSPESDTVVAAAIRTYTDAQGDHWDQWRFDYPGGVYPCGHITHWMPLPQEATNDA